MATNLSKAQREAVHMKFGGKCAYCGCDLPKRWHADHVEPVWREWWKKKQGIPVQMSAPERDVIGNLFPACPACNIDKHANTLENWRSIIQDKVRVLRDNYKAFGHAERFGLVQEIKKPVLFWFEIFAATESSDRGQSDPV